MPSPSAVRSFARLCRRDQRRLHRHINEFGDYGVSGQARQSIASSGCPCMPSVVVLTRSSASASAASSSSQRATCTRAPNVAAAFGSAEGTVDENKVLHAAVEETVNDRARRAAGAKHDRFCKASIPKRCSSVEIVQKTFDVGIGRMQHAVVEPQRVGGADRAGALIGLRRTSAASLCGKVTLAPT